MDCPISYVDSGKPQNVKVLEPESSIKLCTVELGLIGKDVRFGDFFPDLCIGNLHY